MQKTDLQRTGYLSRKSDNGTWSNRYITLNIDSGAMKFYVEKSGKKTMKSQVNIKKGKFTSLTVEEAGKPFAFQLVMEEMIGKSEDANLILAAPDEAQFNEWKEEISICYSYIDSKRRKSLLASPAASTPENEPAEVMKPPIEMKPITETKPSSETKSLLEAKVPVETKAPIEAKSEKPQSESSSDTLRSAVPIEENEAKRAPFERTPSKEEKSNQSRRYDGIEVIVTSDSEDGMSVNSGKPPRSPRVNSRRGSHSSPKTIEAFFQPAPTADPVNHALEEKLEKMGRRNSYKPPKKLGNLLNSKGLTPELEEEMKRAKQEPSEEKKAEEVEGIALKTAQPEPEPVAPPKPRQLVISVRPTSPIREGYLFKMDHTLKEQGDDPWISQFISLEIATGILQYYAELGGRRIARGKVNILESIVEPIDLVYHGRLYSFKLLSGPETNPEKVVSTFAAEDLESFSYWLISFDDCFKYQEDLRDKLIREEEEKRQIELQRMQLAVDSIARSRSLSNVFQEPSLTPLEPKASFLGDVFPTEKTLERKQSTRSDTSEKALERKGSLRLDHLGQHLSHASFERSESISEKRNDAVTTSKAVSHKFHEDPGPMSRPPSFTYKDAHFSQDDMDLHHGKPSTPRTDREKEKEKEKEKDKKEKSRSRSITGAPGGGSVGPLLHLNEHNSIDDLLSFNPPEHHPQEDGTATPDGLPPKGQHRSRRNSEHEMMEIKNFTFQLKKASYPADRLSRRVKIWYCSGGFSLSTEEEITQFVDALKNTEDATLKAFSEEKFEHIHDWSNLLEVLRKYEQKVLAEAIHQQETSNNPNSNAVAPIETLNAVDGHMHFLYEITIPSRPDKKIEFEFTDDFDFDALVKKMAETFGFSELSLFACVPPLLTTKESPWCKSLVTMKEDLLFAEDLVLYQEEVIEHMWESYTALKSVIEQKDEVINQLYTQMSDLQDQVSQQIASGGSIMAASPFGTSYYSMNHQLLRPPMTTSKQSPKELQAIADREFYAADKDGDGQLSREEWRNWIQDKTNLIQEHNDVKTALMNEIKNLRKAITPQQEQTYQELKKFEEIRKQQEEELVKLHIEHDQSKQEILALQRRLKDYEQEKQMIESDHQEKVNQLQKQLEELQAVLRPEGGGEDEDQGDSEKQLNAASNIIDNPYAYNYALDRSTGIKAKKERGSSNNKNNNNGEESNGIDLLALATMNNEKVLAQLDSYGEDSLPVIGEASGRPAAGQWQMERYAGETNRLGVETQKTPLPPPHPHYHHHQNNQEGPFYPTPATSQHHNNPFTLRSPEEEQQQQSVHRGPPPTTAKSYLNNLQENQQQARYPPAPPQFARSRAAAAPGYSETPPPPSRFTFDEVSGGSAGRAGSNSRRAISPSAIQSTLVAQVYDHPLRNALRAEAKPTFASAPSPYTSVRSRPSNTNYNHTIGAKLKPRQLKTGTVVNDRRAGATSPHRLSRGGREREREETIIFDYSSSRLPMNNPSYNNSSNMNNAYYESSPQQRSYSPSRFMTNTNSWKQKIQTAPPPHAAPEVAIRATNWRL